MPLTTNFINFKTMLAKIDSKMLAQELKAIIPEMARGMYRVEDMTERDRLIDRSDEFCFGKFFEDVSVSSGDRIAKTKSVTPYENLIKNWNGKSDTLALATYYHLHTERETKPAARRIDIVLFGKSFEDYTGDIVPGGYYPLAPSSSKLDQSDSDLLRRIRETQLEKKENVKIELLMVIAREYDATPPATSSESLIEYILKRVAEWRDATHKLAEIAENSRLDLTLVDAVKNATDQGEFSTADNLLSRALDLKLTSLNKEITSVASILAMKAENFRMARNYMASSQNYDEASKIIAPIDSVIAFQYGYHSANDLYREATISTRLKLLDVSLKYLDLIMRSKALSGLPINCRYGPILSYCGIMSSLYEMGHKNIEISKLEEICSESFHEFKQEDQIVSEVIRSVWGKIVSRYKPISDKKINLALYLGKKSLEILTPQSCPWYWKTAQAHYALTLRDAAFHFRSITMMNQAISHFSTLIRHCDDDEDEMARSYHNIGLCYKDIAIFSNDYSNLRIAISYFYKALVNRRRDNSPILFARTRSAMGSCYALLSMDNRSAHFDRLAVFAFWDAASVWAADQHIKDWWGDGRQLLASLAMCFENEMDTSKAIELAKLAIIQSRRLVNMSARDPNHPFKISSEARILARENEIIAPHNLRKMRQMIQVKYFPFIRPM